MDKQEFIQNGTIEKYQTITNNLLILIDKGEFKGLSNYFRSNNADTHFSSALIAKGYLKLGPRRVVLKTDKTPTTFSVKQVQEIWDEIKNRRPQVVLRRERNEINAPSLIEKTLPTTRKAREGKKSSKMAQFTTKDLIDELRNRGYKGTLTITREIQF